MAAKEKEVNQAQIAAIADIVRASASKVLDGAMNAALAHEEAQTKTGTALSTRTKLVLDFAKMSHAANWQAGEIHIACGDVFKVMSESRNDNTSKKALQNFMSEIRVASAPIVRPHVDTLEKLCKDVWDAEILIAATDKEADVPCKVAFKRYHNMIMSAFTLAKGSVKEKTKPTLLQSYEDVDAWARSRDPSIDLEKLAKRITAIRKELEEIKAGYPVPSLDDAIMGLSDVKESDLREARLSEVTWTFGIPTPEVKNVAAVSSPVEPEVSDDDPPGLEQQIDNLTEITNTERVAA